MDIKMKISLIADQTTAAQDSSTDQSSNIAAAVVSSTVISAVVFFLLGCACGWLGHKYRGTITSKAKSDKNVISEPAPLYEDLQITSIQSPTDQGKAFELKENVAYGPVRLT
jgi:hypothetical protein